MSTLNASGVLSSSVDYFCLVCESRLRDEEDAIAHVAKPVHTKNFLTTEYFGNEQECVRKIKRWYLCELCNALVATAGGVRLHVAGAQHAARRAGRALRRRAGRVLAFARVQLEDSAWNGIVDDTCAVCNTEFDDELIHRNETSHILKLIQTKVEYDENQNLFRRVNDNIIHCITCNNLVELNSMDIHFNEDKHKKLYQNCCEQNKLDSDENEAKTETENAGPDVSIDNAENIEGDDSNKLTVNGSENSKIAEENTEKSTEISDTINADDETTEINLENEDISSYIENFNRNDITVNVELQTAKCKKCEKELDFQIKTIKNHILEHQLDDLDLETIQVTSDTEVDESANGKTSPARKPKKVKAKKPKERSSTIEAKTFAKENDMTYLDTEDKVYCNQCKVNIPTSLKCLQEHVSGSAHLKAINKHSLEVVLFENNNKSNEPRDKIPSKDFAQNMVYINGTTDSMVINDSIYISVFSFNLMVEENNKLKCYICDTKVSMYDFEFHQKQHYHNKKSSESLVVRELSNEFIREIKPRCFHCGYCNSLHSPWSALLAHTQTQRHRESKFAAQIHLRKLMPEIMRKRREREMNIMMQAFGFMFGLNRRRYYDSD